MAHKASAVLLRNLNLTIAELEIQELRIVRQSKKIFADLTSAELDGVINHIDKMRLDNADEQNANEGDYSFEPHFPGEE